MYNSFPNQVSSAAKWIFLGFIIIVFMAILLGGNIKEATWLNSNIAEAEAERIQIESAHQQATYELQERLAAAQTEAEIQQIQREQKMLDARYEHDMKILAQDVVNRQRWTDTGVNLVIFAGGATGISAAIGIVIVAIAKTLAILRSAPRGQPDVAPSRPAPAMQTVEPLPKIKPYDPWSLPTYRRQKIKAARYEERKRRKVEIGSRMNAFKDPTRMSKEEYNKKPLAG